MTLPRMVSSRVIVGVLLAGGLAAGAGVVVLPAVADEGHTEPNTDPPADRVDENGSVIPEPETDSPTVSVTREVLEERERLLDPLGTSSTYVCGNLGEETMTVVRGTQVPSGTGKAANAGALASAAELADSNVCSGMDLIVGRENTGTSR